MAHDTGAVQRDNLSGRCVGASMWGGRDSKAGMSWVAKEQYYLH